MVKGEDVHPYSARKMGSGIVIHNNPRAFMSNLDLDMAFAREFLEYLDIVLAHLPEGESNIGELFVGQQFNNKKDCVHAIKK